MADYEVLRHWPLVIKWDTGPADYGSPIHCALCRDTLGYSEGPALFIECTWAHVCTSCASQLAPELVDVLSDARSGRRQSPAAHELHLSDDDDSFTEE